MLDGDLAALSRLAGRVLASPLEAVIAATAPMPGKGFRLWLGFEGFAETVARGLEVSARWAREEAIEADATSDYDLLAGPFPHLYEEIAARPGLLRIGVPPEQAAAAAESVLEGFPTAPFWVDFAGGRITAGLETPNPGVWRKLRGEISARGGHLTLEKAPAAFFPPGDRPFPTTARDPLAFRIRAAFDPGGIFAAAEPPEPGCAP